MYQQVLSAGHQVAAAGRGTVFRPSLSLMQHMLFCYCVCMSSRKALAMNARKDLSRAAPTSDAGGAVRWPKTLTAEESNAMVALFTRKLAAINTFPTPEANDDTVRAGIDVACRVAFVVLHLTICCTMAAG